jgi:lipopolysaccharide export system protein LptC
MMRTSTATDAVEVRRLARTRAAARHTQRVHLLRLLLPIAALVVLATVFLFLRNTPVGQPASGNMRLEDMETDQVQMTAPTFAGVARDGTQLLATASSARPPVGPDSAISAQTADLRMIPPSGRTLRADAPLLELDPDAGQIVLTGGVRLRDAVGYVMTMLTLTASTDGTKAIGLGPVAGTGPQGDLRAGRMEITRIPDSPDYTTVFNGGVRLVYDPSRPSRPAQVPAVSEPAQ